MKAFKVVLLLGLALSLAACCACRKGKKVVDKPLMATKWTLVELNGQPFQTEDNYYFILDSAESRFNGRGDCNSMMGSYTMGENGKIKFNGIASTRAFCPNQAGEDKFFKTLDEVASLDVDGDLLMLFNGNSELIAVMAAK